MNRYEKEKLARAHGFTPLGAHLLDWFSLIIIYAIACLAIFGAYCVFRSAFDKGYRDRMTQREIQANERAAKELREGR